MTNPTQTYTNETFFAGSTWTPEVAEAVHRGLEALRRMTPDELFQSLVHAGIYSPDGHLLPPYADEEDDTTEEFGPPAGTASK